jgi:hypothetical protein
MRDVFGAEHHLHDTAGVPQVDEHHSAMIPAAGHPARERHVQAVVGGAQRPRVVCPHHG